LRLTLFNTKHFLSGTTNVLPGRKNIKYKIDDILIDTGTDYFGAVVGNDCAVGASVTILPGTQILPTSIVQARSVAVAHILKIAVLRIYSRYLCLLIIIFFISG
jgi:hypothetical protein